MAVVSSGYPIATRSAMRSASSVTKPRASPDVDEGSSRPRRAGSKAMPEVTRDALCDLELLLRPRDHVDQDAEERQEDHEERPPGLRPSAVVAAAEVVGEDHHEQRDPDQPGEED